MILLNDLRGVIEEQLRMYPQMQPQDAVKLVYQHVFGVEPDDMDWDRSLDFIKKEYEILKYSHAGEDRSHIARYENIGNWYARVNLLTVDDLCQLKVLNDLYAATAQMAQGDTRFYISRLYLLLEMAQNGYFTFDADAMDEFLKEYEKAGYPKVAHSGRYKELYDPAYRVIDIRYIRLLPLISRINELLEKKERVVVAFDGKRGAGRSTAALLLSHIYDTTIISMDDFALPDNMITRERLAQPGGNIHYERFLEEVAVHIRKNEKFAYSRYEGGFMNYVARVDAEPKQLMIVDGTYSQHIQYRSIYDIKVFFDIDDISQQNNIIDSRGELYYSALRESWLALDKLYFDHSEIRDKSDIVINF